MTSQDYARKDLLIGTEWLEGILGDPGIRIVDCDQYDEYRRAHIKNAVGIRVHHYLKHPDYPMDPKGHPLVSPPESFKDLMESMAIDNDTLVVVYDNSGSLYAARFWWVLNYYGHTNVKVLNGGWRKWLEEGRPITVDAPILDRASFNVQPNPEMVCTLDFGMDSVGEDGTIFLDVRSEAEWNGSNNRGNKRAGRIPGAVHLEWLNFLNDDKHQTLKPAHELMAMLQDAGVTFDKQVITYCQAGIRAAHGAFVLALLGYDRARNYDGSMGEWANRDDTPLVSDVS